MDTTNDPIVDALKKAFQEHGLEISDPNAEDPIGTVFHAMLKDEVATKWVLVIYDSARRRVELQVASLNEEKGKTYTEEDSAFSVFSLPSGDRLLRAVQTMAHEVYSWLEFGEHGGDDEDDEEDGDDEDDVEDPEEDGSDEEEEGGSNLWLQEQWRPPGSEDEPRLEDWLGFTD